MIPEWVIALLLKESRFMHSHFYNIGFGLGLRTPHYEQILKEKPKQINWFEIISENFLDAHEGYWDFLATLRRDYPIVMHGVSMSIGSTDLINDTYVKKLKKLIDFLQPSWISDHLCFTGINAHNTHDLLPVPYTAAMLQHVVARIQQMQDRLKRRIVIENPSTYLEFATSEMSECDFMREMAQRSGCGILLDINNVYVSSFNHGYNPLAYIDAIPADCIAQIHLAGHHNKGHYILDTHDHPVIDAVWDLYSYTIANKGLCSTMIEWDDRIPSLETLIAELDKARVAAKRADDAYLQHA